MLCLTTISLSIAVLLLSKTDSIGANLDESIKGLQGDVTFLKQAAEDGKDQQKEMLKLVKEIDMLLKSNNKSDNLPGKAECEKGWTKIGDKCYAVFKCGDNCIRNEGVKTCKSLHGGSLAYVRNKEIYDELLQQTINANLSNFQIDGSDEKKEGDWITMTGEKIEFFNWHPGKPDDKQVSNCLEVHIYVDGPGHNDIECDHVYGNWSANIGIACERKI